MILVWGAFLGFISVAFSTYYELIIRNALSSDYFACLSSAIRYNQIYAAIITNIGLTLLNKNKLLGLTISGYLFILGTIMYSFSTYLAFLFNEPLLNKLAPIGNIIIMIAWVSLVAFVTKWRYVNFS